jgi:hypothetical protein
VEDDGVDEEIVEPRSEESYPGIAREVVAAAAERQEPFTVEERVDQLVRDGHLARPRPEVDDEPPPAGNEEAPGEPRERSPEEREVLVDEEPPGVGPDAVVDPDDARGVDGPEDADRRTRDLLEECQALLAESGGELLREFLVRMDRLRPFDEEALLLGVVGVRDAAVNRADGSALLGVVESDALGAELGIDDVDVVLLADRLVGTLGLAGAAADAFLGNHRGH